MKNIPILLLLLLTISCTNKEYTVSLSGVLENFSKEVSLDNMSANDLLLGEKIKIQTDDGKFEIKIPLDEPSYFKLGRNILYLTPGDNVVVHCDYEDSRAAKFEGKGASACSYLAKTAYPKAGSYLLTGALLHGNPDYKEVISRIDKKVTERQEELKALENVSEKFRKLENARISFNAANSYLSYKYYCRAKDKSPNNQLTYEEVVQTAADAFYPEVKKHLSLIDDKDYLDLPVYRNIYHLVEGKSGGLSSLEFPQELKDYTMVSNLIRRLSRIGLQEEILIEKDMIYKRVNNLYKDIIDKAFAEFQTLMPGKAAPALGFSDVEGKVYSLNDFKGKLVVIDVWATWCSPCLAQAPFFEELSHKFNPEKVAFISVSVDSRLDKWKSHISKKGSEKHQYVTSRSSFDSYNIQSIPRFMVIDEASNIIDVFAPLPSSGNLEKLIRENL